MGGEGGPFSFITDLFGGSPEPAPPPPIPWEQTEAGKAQLAQQEADRQARLAEEQAAADKAASDAAAKEAERIKKQQGRKSTLVTGGAGLLDDADTAVSGLKNKLGQ